MNIQRDSAETGAGGAVVFAMARRLITFLFASALLALCGCSTTPPGQLSYFLPKASTEIKISQTLACTAAGDQLVQVVTVTPVTTYSGDANAPASFKPNSVDGPVSNADLAFEYMRDGRLAGVNITSVGQAGEVIKGVIAVAKVAGLVGAAAPAVPAIRGPVTPLAVCEVIARYSAKAGADEKKTEKEGDKKAVAAAPAKEKGQGGAAAKADEPKAESKPVYGPVTLTYAATIDYERNTNKTDNTAGQKIVFAKNSNGQYPGKFIEISPDANSSALHAVLKETMHGLTFQVHLVGTTDLPVPTWTYPSDNPSGSTQESSSAPQSHASLVLNKLAGVRLKVTGPNNNPKVLDQRPDFWEAIVPVPLTAETDRFSVPIPKAAMFGTRKFSLTLTDYGTISKISYGSTNVVSEGASAATAIASVLAAKPADPTEAELAKGFKDQADRVYQQNRAAVCLARPDDCEK